MNNLFVIFIFPQPAMLIENIYRLIHFDEYSGTPKNLQLTHSILKGIEEGRLEKDYILPSINDLSYELKLAATRRKKPIGG